MVDRDAAVKITASRMDAEMDGFATGLSTAICRDGQSTITANIPFAGFKITGLGNASADTDGLNRRLGDGRYGVHGTSTGGSSNGYTLAGPATTTLTTGMVIAFVANHTNTGASTMVVTPAGASALASKAIIKISPTGLVALSAGDITDDGHYVAIYDSTYSSDTGGWVLLNPTLIGTTAHFWANTAGKTLITDKVWTAAAPTAVDYAASISYDLSTGFDFTTTLTGNLTLANVTNIKVGQKGIIVLTQDGTGSRLLSAVGTWWKFPGGSVPSLTTTAAAVDEIHYWCKTSTYISAGIRRDVR